MTKSSSTLILGYQSINSKSDRTLSQQYSTSSRILFIPQSPFISLKAFFWNNDFRLHQIRSLDSFQPIYSSRIIISSSPRYAHLSNVSTFRKIEKKKKSSKKIHSSQPDVGGGHYATIDSNSFLPNRVGKLTVVKGKGLHLFFGKRLYNILATGRRKKRNIFRREIGISNHLTPNILASFNRPGPHAISLALTWKVRKKFKRKVYRNEWNRSCSFPPLICIALQRG